MSQTTAAESNFCEEKIQLTVHKLDKDIENRKLYYAFKRFFDFTASLLSLIILSPVLLIIALLIFLDDPHGSPVFTQERVGKNDKTFKFYKFRSMVVNAEDLLDDLQDQNEKDGPVFKIKNDPRVTKIGRFIRRTSIDELPQLLNILKGDMSFVGPRPALLNEVKQYTTFQRQRLLVTPGLTCFWQASSRRDEIGFDEWVSLDVKYIREQNLLLDFKLILATFKAVFTSQGN